MPMFLRGSYGSSYPTMRTLTWHGLRKRHWGLLTAQSAAISAANPVELRVNINHQPLGYALQLMVLKVAKHKNRLNCSRLRDMDMRVAPGIHSCGMGSLHRGSGQHADVHHLCDHDLLSSS